MIGKIEGGGGLREGKCDGVSQREVIRGKIEMRMCCTFKMSMIHLLLHSTKILAWVQICALLPWVLLFSGFFLVAWNEPADCLAYLDIPYYLYLSFTDYYRLYSEDWWGAGPFLAFDFQFSCASSYLFLFNFIFSQHLRDLISCPISLIFSCLIQCCCPQAALPHLDLGGRLPI